MANKCREKEPLVNPSRQNENSNPPSSYITSKANLKSLQPPSNKTSTIRTEDFFIKLPKSNPTTSNTVSDKNANQNSLVSKKPSNSATISASYPAAFGVKNYLHQFYDKADVRNSHMYEDMPFTDGRGPIFVVKRTACSWSVFRLSLALGGLILLMGATVLAVALCTSKKPIIVGKMGGVAVVDRIAASHNAEIDALILVGMIALVLGAVVIAATLISKTFCARPDYEEDEERIREGIWPGYDSIYDHPPFLNASNVKLVPATKQVSPIQPEIRSQRRQ